MMKKFSIPECLFVLYFWGLVMLRPFLQENLSESTLILTIFVFTLLCAFLVYVMLIADQRIETPVIIMGLMVVVLLTDAVFRFNSHSYMLLYEFIYFGVVPVILLSKVTNVRRLLLFYSWASAVAFTIYATDPLMGYPVFSDYMGYGYKLALPAFLGCFIGFHYLRIRWMIIFEVLAFLSLMMFANRSALLGAIVFSVLYILIWRSFSLFAMIKRIVAFAIFLALAYVNIDALMDSLFRFTSAVSFKSYAIQKFNYFLASGSADEVFFSGRIHIWNHALSMFYDQPIVGYGTGSFMHKYGYYPHNVVLDLLVSYGLIGFMVIGYFLYRSTLVLGRSHGDVKLLSLLLLTLWFPKLLFSMMFINDTAFWSYFVLFLFPFVPSARRLPDFRTTGELYFQEQ